MYNPPPIQEEPRDAYPPLPDLKRMNRILEVNERNAYALVEPGVTYFDLYRDIQERGLKLWIDPNGVLAAGRYGIWPRHLRRA